MLTTLLKVMEFGVGCRNFAMQGKLKSGSKSHCFHHSVLLP